MTSKMALVPSIGFNIFYFIQNTSVPFILPLCPCRSMLINFNMLELFRVSGACFKFCSFMEKYA